MPASGPVRAAERCFPETGQCIDGRRGASEAESLALFGLPPSDPQVENTTDGRFTAQWFERALAMSDSWRQTLRFLEQHLQQM